VAIKEMLLTPMQMNLVLQEIAVMKKAKHRCVVEFFDAYLVSDRLWIGITLLRVLFASPSRLIWRDV